MAVQAKARVVFKRQIDGKTLGFTLSPSGASTSQVKSKDPVAYGPDYTKTNLIVTPLLSDGRTNKVQSTPKWFVDEGSGYTEITSATAGFTIATSGSFALTVKKNFERSSSIKCSYTYSDPDNSAVKTDVTAYLPITVQENPGTLISAEVVPNSSTVFETREGAVKTLTFNATMRRGSDPDATDVTFTWQITDDKGNWVDATTKGCTVSGNSTTTHLVNPILSVPSTAVLNFASLRVTAKDTDPTSSTYNKTTSSVPVPIIDMTDPYEIYLGQPNGESISRTSSTGNALQMIVTQGDDPVSDAFYNNKTLRFWRTTDSTVDAVDTTAWAGANDFSGWTKNTTSGDENLGTYSRTYSSGNGTLKNRTVYIKYNHIKAESAFIVTLEA